MDALEILFFILSAGLIWVTKPPIYVDKIIRDLNLDPEKGLGAFTEGVVLALLVLLIKKAIEIVSERTLIFSPHYLGGVWMFALTPETNEEFTDERRTVGIFIVKPSKRVYSVSFGESFLIESENLLRKRGEWAAKYIVQRDDGIDFIYRLETNFRYREERDTDYQGVISLRARGERGLIGSSYSGFFNDLQKRSHVKGPIYAEHVSRFRIRKKKYLEKLYASPTAFHGRLN